MIMEPGGGYIQNVTTGEKIKLRVDRGVYVFDVKFSEGDRVVVAFDSGAGVSVWPKDWENGRRWKRRSLD